MAGAKIGISFDADRAIRDPLFWLDMIISRVTFGRIETGRWKRYVTVQDDEPQPILDRSVKPPMPPKRG